MKKAMPHLRMTSQREIILRELKASSAHPSADELYDIVKKSIPRISLATVYRNLEILFEAGLIGKLEIGGRQKRFDGDPSFHHHIYCVKCHRVENLDLSSSIDLSKVVTVCNYEISGYRLEISGICPSCQSKEAISIPLKYEDSHSKDTDI